MLLLATSEWMETYLNYPGLEAWKFINLAIFVTAGIIILRKPLAQALAARGESIKRELAKAQEERDQASQDLASADEQLARLNGDVESIRSNARKEAEEERERQKRAAIQETERLKAQAARELDLIQRAARKELQQFLAKRSVDLAKESVVQQLRPEDDLRMIRDRLSDFRRAKG